MSTTNDTTTHHYASPPSKATGTIDLSLGAMRSVVISVYTGIETPTPTRTTLWRDEHGELREVASVKHDKETGEVVDVDDLVRGYIRNDGVFVECDDETYGDLKTPVSEKNGTGQVLAFYRLSELNNGLYVLGDLKQARPHAKTPGSAEKFALLIAAMRRTQTFALCKIVTRNKARIVALLPNGDLYDVLFDQQVRERLPMPDVEIERAEKIALSDEIEKRLAKERTTVDDEWTLTLLDFIEKAKVPHSETTDDDADDETPDLMAALNASLGKETA